MIIVGVRHALPSSFAVPYLEVPFLFPSTVGRWAGDEGLEDQFCKFNPYKNSNNPSEGSEPSEGYRNKYLIKM